MLEKITKINKELQEINITPFDLMSWEFLLELEAETSSNKFLDLDMKFALRKEIINALHRKAKVLDECQNTDFYSKILTRVEQY